MTENSVKLAQFVMQSARAVGACPIIDLFLQPPDKYVKLWLFSVGFKQLVVILLWYWLETNLFEQSFLYVWKEIFRNYLEIVEIKAIRIIGLSNEVMHKQLMGLY